MNFFKKYKSEILLSGGALLAGILSFVITLNVYPLINKNNNQAENKVAIGGGDELPLPAVDNINEPIASISDKASEPQTFINNDNTLPDNDLYLNDENNYSYNSSENNIDIQTSADINQNEDILNQNDFAYNNSNQSSNLEASDNLLSNEEILNILDQDKAKEDIKNLDDTIETISRNIEQGFLLPISGDVILEFAKDKLVYSETLDEWITHDGIDIYGKTAEPVKSAGDGTVESVKMDPRYGYTIIINHGNNVKTVYSNLSTLDLVYAGKEVKAGDIISGIGEGFGFENKEGPHIHFEIIKDGENINPLIWGRPQ